MLRQSESRNRENEGLHGSHYFLPVTPTIRILKSYIWTAKFWLCFAYILLIFFSNIGACYARVKAETEKMKASMDHTTFYHDQPRQEVTYLFKGEKANDLFGKKSRYIVEVEDERPKWWTKNQLQKANEWMNKSLSD